MPEIMLDPRDLWCKRHLEALIPQVNIIQATLKMYNTFLVDARILKFCGYDKEKGQLADASKIAEAIESHLPLCCFLGDSKMEEVFALAVTEDKPTN